MSEREKGAVLEALNQLDELDKRFILGYAAGRSASVDEADAEDGTDTNEQPEGGE